MTLAAQILVVDDEEPIRLLLQAALSRAGHTVLLEPDGFSGLEMALNHKPDLIITDLIMPEMDGMEFIHQVRSHPELSQTPILLLTADNPGEVSVPPEPLFSVLFKPFALKDLMSTVEKILGGPTQNGYGALPGSPSP